MFVPQAAEVFQEKGINALVYDPRSLGESDGQPRNEIDPSKQVSDYSDALSFLLAQKTVDPERIAVWGMSFSATIALCAASLDKRAKLCIAACPYLELKPPPEKLPQVLAKCMKDRESRHVGNPPTYLPMLTATGRNPAGLRTYFRSPNSLFRSQILGQETCLGSVHSLDMFQTSLYSLKQAMLTPKS